MGSRTYTFHTFGEGQEVQATVHFGSEEGHDAKGIAILFHGGGFVLGSKEMIPESQISALIDLGFVAVTANYRLCPQVSLWDGPIADARNVHYWSQEKLPALLQQDAGVTVDPGKIVALGYSAGGLLALFLGTLSPPPSAIADFYGVKLLSDPSWFSPLPALSRLPDFEPSFLNKIFDEPTVTSTQPSTEENTADSAKKEGGGFMPDLSKPRNAWVFGGLKEGTNLSACVQDGNYERCDPARSFGKAFPPTVFVHGTKDDLVEARLSEEACKLLDEKGGTAELLLVEGVSHGFDTGLEKGDEVFERSVKPALEFLARHV